MALLHILTPGTITSSIGGTFYAPQEKMHNWSSEHVRTAVNSGMNLFKHKEEALISHHPSLITGCSGGHVTPPPVYCEHTCEATEGRVCARSTTTTSSLCVNKQQASNSSCTLKNDIHLLSLRLTHKQVSLLFKKLPWLLNYLIAHMFSMHSKPWEFYSAAK